MDFTKVNGHAVPGSSQQQNGVEMEPMRSTTSMSTESVSSVDFSNFKSPTPSVSPQPPEKRELLLHNEFIEVPHKLFKTEEFFRSVLTKEAFYSLSEASRTRLIKNNLSPEMSANLDDTLDYIFGKDPSHGFLPPMTTVFKRFQAGFYNRPHTSDSTQLRDFHRVLHNHFIRNHHMRLLRQLVKNRHEILENACQSGASEKNIVAKSRKSKRKFLKEQKLKKRSKKRFAMMLNHVNEVVGVDMPSSDESEAEDTKLPLQILESDRESTLYDPKFGRADLDLHQPTELSNVQTLLKQYKHLREVNPDCPSLDIDGITLEEVYERVGLSYQSEKNYALYRKQLVEEQAAEQSKTTVQESEVKIEPQYADEVQVQ
ncbi:hypothetical protein M3Y96_01161400 [Aphelenchoides besseyi]|nr:hypothetical protein M3Y96_01161400 [Aphelenchoides besseyi]